MPTRGSLTRSGRSASEEERVKEKFTEGRLDRRGFLAAAGAAAATGAAASTMGPLSGAAGGKTSAKATKSGADDGLCHEHPAELPKIRRGIQTYSTPAVVWSTKETSEEHFRFLKSVGLNAWEFAGSYPVVDGVNLGTNPAGWATFGSYAKQYGFQTVGPADGPDGH